MKKIAILIALLCWSATAFSQTITVTPQRFTALDEITITVNVSGNARLEALTSGAFLWMWSPGVGDAPSNVNPASSNPDRSAPARFTRVEGQTNVYQLRLIPAVFLNLAPGQVTRVGMILKGNDWGDGQTPDFLFDVEPLTFTERVNRTFPNNFTPDDVATFYLNRSLATQAGIRTAQNVEMVIRARGLNAAGNPIDLGTTLTLDATFEGDNRFAVTIIPSGSFPIPAGGRMTELIYRFRNKENNVQTEEFSKTLINQ